MKRLLIVCALPVILALFCPYQTWAQDRKLVTGRITNKVTGKPFGKNDVLITIYAFDTEALAEDALKALNDNQTVVGAYEVMPPDASGYYQATLPETGALIFKLDISPGVLERVNYRTEINVALDAGEVLEASTKTETATGIVELEEEVEIDGNYLYALYTFKVPQNIGKSNARLILQPYFMEGVTYDTLSFLKPWVFDGTQYHLTQERRMGYDPGNDPIMKYVREDTLTSTEFLIYWRDTVYLENPRGRYYVKGKIIAEDYNKVYFVRDSLPLASSRARRPMQFLNYELDRYELDPEEYHVRARPEKMNTAGEISLSFLVGRAQLDDRDTMNRYYLNTLKKNLLDIVNGENSRLNEFHIVGVASPDGTYSKNQELARKRIDFAMSQIVSVLPRDVRRRVYMTTKAKVAPWSDVAGLLEADSLTAEAADIRKIIAANEGNHDRQGMLIRKLPYYKSVVTEYLPKLRTVNYVYVHEEMRELTPEEIYDRYFNDEEYRSGKKHFALYEYWHLFRMVKDSDELARIYRRAYDESLEDNGEPWILAANNLALSLLDRDIADTTILAPFIDTRYKCNRRFMLNDGTFEKINPDAVVANQLRMFLMQGQFGRASVMSQMLPDTDEYRVLKAVTMCLGGYYKGGKTPEERQQRQEWFEIVKESNPVNRVVMCLAPNTRAYTEMAEKAIADLSPDDPLTWYFKAVVSSRKSKYPNADFMEPMNFEAYLLKCLELDPKYLDIALADGDIDEDMLKDFMKYNGYQ